MGLRPRSSMSAGLRLWAALAFVWLASASLPARALTLEDAIVFALESNPEIGQAIESRAAIGFELRQARGLYLPRIDAEASTGPRTLDSPGRRATGFDDDILHQRETGGTLTWKLFDGFNREAQIERQGFRADGASFRIWERSEFIALAIAKEFFEILLQGRIAEIAEINLEYHRRIADRIRRGVSGGSLTSADNQQAQERLKSAEARVLQAQDELLQARSQFFRLVAQPASGLGGFRPLSEALPRSLDLALIAARTGNPQIKLAEADLNAVHALVKAARARHHPEVVLEGRVRNGVDLDGIENRTVDAQARIVTRFNLFNGGIDWAAEQQQIRQMNEARFKLHQIQREVEAAVRTAWDKRIKQHELVTTLREQARLGKRVVDAYEEQFRAGRRTLLDVLSAQSTYTNTRVLAEISHYAEVFATYRVMAAMGELLPALGVRASIAPAAEAGHQAGRRDLPINEAMQDHASGPYKAPSIGVWHTVRSK